MMIPTGVLGDGPIRRGARSSWTWVFVVALGACQGRQPAERAAVPAVPSQPSPAPSVSPGTAVGANAVPPSVEGRKILTDLRARLAASGGADDGQAEPMLKAGLADGFHAGPGGLRPHFGLSAEPVSANLVLPQRSPAAFHLEDARSRVSVDVSLKDAQPADGHVADGYVIFPRAHVSGATVLHRALPSGVEDFVSFEKRPPTPNVAYRVALGERVAGLRLVENTLEMLDAGGAPRLRVTPPFLIGAQGASADAVLAVEGCAVDKNPAGPWGRPTTAPGASACTVRVSWGAADVEYPAVLDPRWTTTTNMQSARQNHTATLLANGKVLAAGGRTTNTGTTGLATAELFDRTTGLWAATGSMTGGRWFHSAVQLGTTASATTSLKVLIAGGINGTTSVNTAQLYDATAGTWVAAGNLNAARHLHSATRLSDGRVLVAGGMNGTTVLNTGATYNPASGAGTWTAVATNMASARRAHTAILLSSSNTNFNNKVLIVGGNSGGTTSLTSVQMFDGTAWSSSTALPSTREGHTATLLTTPATGRVLITGGKSGSTTLGTTLLFTIPTSGTAATWPSAGTMTSIRSAHTATAFPSGILASGQVLVAGGRNATASLSSAELWNGTSTWTATSTAMPAAVEGHTATLMSNSAVLIAGGLNGSTTVNVGRIYDPSFGLTCTAGTQCASGFCANGVCCDQACNGGCGACNLTGFVGTCRPLPSTTTCRTAAAGGCDVAEMCNGTALTCPADVFASTSTVCRTAAAGGCDVAENCPGNAAACPADGFAPSSTVCRAAAAGGCDIAEVCPGNSAACPTNAFAPTSTVCRAAAAGGCDVAEVCPGNAATCPSDVFAPTSTVCRAAAPGGCDVAEVCPGNAATCPSDGFAPTSTVCRAAAPGGCDVAETCPGTLATCPSDGFAPDGTTGCTDNNACTTGDRCVTGQCQPTGGTTCAGREDITFYKSYDTTSAIADIAATKNTPEVANPITLASGLFGMAVDSSTNELVYSTSVNASPTNVVLSAPGSVSMWIRADAQYSPAAFLQHALVTLFDWSANLKLEVRIAPQGIEAGIHDLHVPTQASYSTSSSASTSWETDGQWHLVVVNWSRLGIAISFDAGTTYSTNAAWLRNVASGPSLGNWVYTGGSSSSGSPSLPGLARDELMILNRPLSESEIQTYYSRRNSPTVPNPALADFGPDKPGLHAATTQSFVPANSKNLHVEVDLGSLLSQTGLGGVRLEVVKASDGSLVDTAIISTWPGNIATTDWALPGLVDYTYGPSANNYILKVTLTGTGVFADLTANSYPFAYHPGACNTPTDVCRAGAGSRHPTTGACEYAQSPNGTICTDGNACTDRDTCIGGTCTSGPDVPRDDFNTCTTDSCDPALGPVHTPTNESGACDDGNGCTAGDLCHVGVCQPGAVRAACGASEPFYAPMVDLGSYGPDGTQALGINNSGEVVGTGSFPDYGDWGGERLRSFRFTDSGGLVPVIPAVPNCGWCANSLGWAISDNGVVAGQIWGGGAAFTQLPGQPVYEYLAEIGNSVAYAINAAGQFAGYDNRAPTGSLAFRYSPGVGWVSLGTLPHPTSHGNSWAHGIDANGRVVGSTAVGILSDAHAFLFSDAGGIQDLNDLATSPRAGFTVLSWASAVTPNHIVGAGFRPDGTLHGFRYHEGGAVDDIGTVPSLPAMYQSWASAVNVRGDVVGQVHGATSQTRAFVYTSEGQIRDLNDYVAPGTNWTLEVASGINFNSTTNTSEVVGWGTHSGVQRAFKMKLPNLVPCEISADICHPGAGVRNPATGECTYTAVANNTPCVDTDPCTTTAFCQAGACVPGPLAIDDSNPCTADTCTPTGPEHTPITGTCDDKNACTVGDVCQAGVCQPGPATGCNSGTFYAPIIEIPPSGLSGATTEARGINEQGEVVGNEFGGTGPGSSRALRYTEGVPVVTLPAGTRAYGINNATAGISTIVGASANGGSAFTQATGGQVVTYALGTGPSHAWSINDSGQIAGYHFPPASNAQGFRYDTMGASLQPVGTLTGPQFSGVTDGRGIDAAGRVVGYAGILSPSEPLDIGRAFIFAGSGPMQDLTNQMLPGSGFTVLSVANATNGTYVVGYGYRSDVPYVRAFRYREGGQVNELGTLPAYLPWQSSSSAEGINQRGDIVGRVFQHQGGDNRAFVYTVDGQMHSLNDFVAPVPDGSGWVLEVATGINNNYEVVGYGTHNSVTRAFKMKLPNLASCPVSTDTCHPGSGTRVFATGECKYTPVADGTACDDTNANTSVDACRAGTCYGSNPPTTGSGTYAGFTDLGVIDGARTSGATAINNNGDVAGTEEQGVVRSVAWRYTASPSPGSLAEIGVGPADASWTGWAATGINNAGTVVGVTGFNGEGFVAQPGQNAQIITEGHGNASAAGINTAGQIAATERVYVGAAFQGYVSAFRRDTDGSKHYVGLMEGAATPGGGTFHGSSTANGIAANGTDLVGYARMNEASRVVDGVFDFVPPWEMREAYRFTDPYAGATDRHNLNDYLGASGWDLLYEATATNGAYVVGWGVKDTRCRAFRYSVATNELVDLNGPSSVETSLEDTHPGADLCWTGTPAHFNYYYPTAINGNNEIVGSISYGGAFYYSDALGQMIDLQDFVDPALHVTLLTAQGINDSHEIAGSMLVAGDPQSRAYKMTLPDWIGSGPSTSDIALRFDGIANFSPTDRVAIFSYNNSSQENVHVPYGTGSPLNTLTINNVDIQSNSERQVPELFLVGDHPASLVVPWLATTTTMTWTVGLQSVTGTDSGTPLTVGPTPDGDGYGPTLPTGPVNLRPTFAATIATSRIATDYTLDAQGKKIAAGSVPGTFDVTSDGAATYVIPIEVPPGRNGMTPRLALQYNSRGGDGPFGIGWNLSGLSQIRRCKRTIAQDGAPAQVKFDSTDRFCLDGKRLVEVTALDSSTLEFRTEGETYTKVTVPKATIDASGPRSFEVRTPDGLIHQYNYDPALDAARVHPVDDPANVSVDFLGITNQPFGDGTPGRLFWNLSSTRDRFGNTIAYSYQSFPAGPGFGGVETILKSVVYLDHQGTAPTKLSVEFQFKNRPDPTFAYVAGARYNLTQIFSSIDVKYNNTVVRSYPLTYLNDLNASSVSGRSLLHSVGLCAPDGACVRPTTFVVGVSPGATVLTDEEVTLPSNIDVLAAGDFDGDGRDDLVYHAGTAWKVAMAISEFGAWGPPISLSLVAPMVPNPNMKAVQVTDLDMDGRADLIILTVEGSGSSALGYWHYFRSLGDGSFEELPMGPTTYAPLGSRLVTADLNGDGFPEILRPGSSTEPSGVMSWFYLANSQGTLTVPQNDKLTPLSTVFGTGAWSVDLFGAGTSHLLTGMHLLGVPQDQTLSRISHASLDAGGQPVQVVSNLRTTVQGNAPVDTYFADVNGDGLPDAIAGVMDPATKRESPALLLNSGTGFMLTSMNALGPSPSAAQLLLPAYPRGSGAAATYPCGESVDNPCANVKVLDWNGDGRDDLMILDNGRSDASQFGARSSAVIYISTGTAFTPITVSIPVPSDARLSVLLDHDGSSLPSILQKETDGAFHLHSQVRRPDGLIFNFTTGEMLDHSVDYAPLASWKGNYSRGTCSAPMYCVARGPWAVSEVTSGRYLGGDPSQRTKRYSYADARTDLNGLGWLGVAYQFATEVETGVVSGTHFWGVGGPVRQGSLYPQAGMPIGEFSVAPYTPTGGPTSANLATARTFGYESLDLGSGIDPLGKRFLARLTTTKDIRAEVTGPVSSVVFSVAGAILLGTPVLAATPKMRDVTDTFVYDPATGALTQHGMISTDGYQTTDIVTNGTEDPANWLVHLPSVVQTTDTSPLGRMQTRTRQYLRDVTGSPTRLATPFPTGAVTDVILEPAGAQNPQSEVYLKTHFDRSPDFGVIRRVTETDASQRQRVTTLQLTDDQLYPREIVNAEGHHASYVFHPGYGVQLLAKDPNQIATGRLIDGLGRTKLVAQSGQPSVSWQYTPRSFEGMTIRRSIQAGPTSIWTLDQWGRVTRSEETTAAGQMASTVMDYDVAGINVVNVYRPIGPAAPLGPKTVIRLDNLGRPVSVTRAGNLSAETRLYEGNKTTITSETGTKQITTSDSLGRIRESKGLNDSSAEVTTSYRFSVSGQLEQVTLPGTNGTGLRSVIFDLRDRPVLQIDPDSGISSRKYNGFGDVVSRIEGLNIETTDVDGLGRPTRIENKDATNRIEWDTAQHGVGNVASGSVLPKDSTFAASSVTYSYEPSGGQMSGMTYAIGARDYTVQRTFDAFGRLEFLQYPSLNGQGLTLKQTYNTFTSQLQSVADANAPTDPTRVFWKALDRDLEGRILRDLLGNGVTEIRTYDVLGRISTINATTDPDSGSSDVEYIAYQRNEAGSVRLRDDAILGTHETFEYDALNRLKFWNYTGRPGTGTWRIRYPYDDMGNLRGRAVDSGAGTGLTFNYGESGHGAGPHAITSSDFGSYGYDFGGQQVSAPGRPLVTYNMNGLPSMVRRDSGNEVRYSFDVWGQRVRKTDSTGAPTAYVDRYYEHRGGSEEVFNIFADGRKVAEISGTNGAASPIRYLHEDGLGSVVTLTNQSGVPETQYRTYDPFGRRFDYQTSPLADVGALSSSQTGFIGEDEDPDAGLVNLNARLYDSRVGRFISPDPVVGRPLDGQSFNRYSYGYNDPLTFTDRSGLCGAPGDDGSDPRCPPLLVVPGDPEGWRKGATDTARGVNRATNWLFGNSGTANPARSAWTNPPAQSPWTNSRPADFNGNGTGDAPSSPTGGAGTPPGAQGANTVLAANGNVPGLLDSSRTGWDLISSQGVRVDEYGQAHAATTLAPNVSRGLQPLFNGIGRAAGVPPVRLDRLEVIVGTPEGQSRSLPGGAINLATPGSGSRSYNDTLRSILHELGHAAQRNSIGEGAFLDRWRAEDAAYGPGAYDVPGTLEWRADQFRDSVLQQAARFGL